MHFGLWYSKWNCIILLSVSQKHWFWPVVIILCIISASKIVDCKAKLTLLAIRMGLDTTVLEVCREDVKGSALCGGCNGLRGSNRKSRYLFCPISSSYLPESPGGSPSLWRVCYWCPFISWKNEDLSNIPWCPISSYGRYPAQWKCFM